MAEIRENSYVIEGDKVAERCPMQLLRPLANFDLRDNFSYRDGVISNRFLRLYQLWLSILVRFLPPSSPARAHAITIIPVHFNETNESSGRVCFLHP